MLGRHHLLLSTLTAAAVFIPLFFLSPILALLGIAGVGIGSLLPDVDSPDAAIYHQEVRGLSGTPGDVINSSLAPVFPLFAYMTEYLVFKPAVYVYDTIVFADREVELQHRGFTHSILGIGTTTVVLGIYLTAFVLLVHHFVTPLFDVVALLLFIGCLGIGQVLHSLQDTATKSGIRWFTPFSSVKYAGQLRTTARPADRRPMEGMAAILTVNAGGLFFVAAMQPWVLTPALTAVISVPIITVLWIGFLFWVGQVRSQ